MTTVELDLATQRRPPTAAEVFTRAADLLEEFGWCQDAYALDANRDETECVGGDATSFCLWGAIQRACWDLSPGLAGWDRYDQLSTYRRRYGIMSIKWNDRLWRQKRHVIRHLRDLAKQEKNA